MDPSLVKLKEILLVIMVVRCSGDLMEVSLGVQQRISTRTIRRIPGRLMCELGDLVGLTDGILLGYATIEVAVSFSPRCSH